MGFNIYMNIQWIRQRFAQLCFASSNLNKKIHVYIFLVVVVVVEVVVVVMLISQNGMR